MIIEHRHQKPYDSCMREACALLLFLLLAATLACGKSAEEKLFQSTAKGDVPSVSRLIVKGANVNARDAQGSTPLHCAPSPEMASLLIANGAMINVVNSQGTTPLHLAEERKNERLAQVLLKQGADASARDANGVSPLYSAQNAQMASDLIKHGAKVNETDERGITPLHVAAGKNRLDVARSLIEQGANVNARDRELGNTPLHYAMGLAFPEMALMLLEAGAQINQANAYGYTPLHYTAKTGCVRVTREMLLHGANPRAVTTFGDSVLDFAINSGNPTIETMVRQAAITYPAVLNESIARQGTDSFSQLCQQTEARRLKALGMK